MNLARPDGKAAATVWFEANKDVHNFETALTKLADLHEERRQKTAGRSAVN